MALDATFAVELGFTSPSRVYPDPDRPPLLRARAKPSGPYGNDDGIEVHTCDATDLLHDGAGSVDLFDVGFDRVDLTDHVALQRACANVREAGQISDADASCIRAALDGAVLRCSSGRRLTVQYVADEGLIMRTAGPNRLSLVGTREKGMNGHGPATSVHGDQDVHGTPLIQLMGGRAPELFRHDSPDAHNHDASLLLVNLWIPLQQITQPLVLGDGRSIDRPRQQLRYGLPTDTFLDRDDDQVVNDIWAFLHDDDQRWFFCSEMDHRSAYVFNTLSTPHGSAIVPGEDVAEQCYLALQAAESAIERGDASELGRVLSEAGDRSIPDRAPPALRRAIADMIALLAEAGADPVGLCRAGGQGWVTRSRVARRRVVRMSVELRMVVSADT
jgi:hypothetical protein